MAQTRPARDQADSRMLQQQQAQLSAGRREQQDLHSRVEKALSVPMPGTWTPTASISPVARGGVSPAGRRRGSVGSEESPAWWASTLAASLRQSLAQPLSNPAAREEAMVKETKRVAKIVNLHVPREKIQAVITQARVNIKVVEEASLEQLFTAAADEDDATDEERASLAAKQMSSIVAHRIPREMSKWIAMEVYARLVAAAEEPTSEDEEEEYDEDLDDEYVVDETEWRAAADSFFVRDGDPPLMPTGTKADRKGGASPEPQARKGGKRTNGAASSRSPVRRAPAATATTPPGPAAIARAAAAAAALNTPERPARGGEAAAAAAALSPVVVRGAEAAAAPAAVAAAAAAGGGEGGSGSGSGGGAQKQRTDAFKKFKDVLAGGKGFRVVKHNHSGGKRTRVLRYDVKKNRLYWESSRVLGGERVKCGAITKVHREACVVYVWHMTGGRHGSVKKMVGFETQREADAAVLENALLYLKDQAAGTVYKNA